MVTLHRNLKMLAMPLALSLFLAAAVTQVGAQSRVEGKTLAALPAAAATALSPAGELTADDLERRFYAKTYEGESTHKRLARLEISVFGELRQGRPESERLRDLNSAVQEKDRASALAAAGAAAGGAVKPDSPKRKETYLTWYRKAGADIRLKRYHAAADELLESIKLNPRFPDAYAYMGDVLLKLKDREGAKEAYKACFEVDRPVVMVAMAGLNYWVWLIKRLISVPLPRIAPG